MPRTPSRRETLQAVGAVIGGGLAGCLDGGDAPTEQSPVDSPTDTPTDTDAQTHTPGADVHVGIRNESETEHDVTLTIASDGEVVHEGTYPVGDGISSLAQGAGATVSVPGTYTVTAALGDGTEATYEWVLEGALRDLTVVVTAEGTFDFERNVRCGPACEPVSQGGEHAALPYAVPGNEETFTTGGVTVETDHDEAVTLQLSIAHDGTTILDYTYDLQPDYGLSIGDVVSTAGAYDVTVSTDSGAETTYTWDVPAGDNYPSLYVLVDADGTLRAGCGSPGTAHVDLESSAGEARAVSLALRRDGTTVAEETVSVEAGGEATASLPYPVGDTFDLVAATSAGHEDSAAVAFCYCYSDEPSIQVTDDGLTVESMRLVCE